MGMLVAVVGVFAGLLLAAPAVHATTAPPPASESPAPESSTEATPQESGNSEGDEETDGAEYQDRISGVLRNAGAPVAGVTIKASGNGYEAETETAENGSWSIGVPEQGAFEVELDESTLPEGVALAEGQQNPRTVTFAGTSNITTLFLLGEGIVLQGDTFGTKLIERAVAGLSFGLLLALSAVGLSLIFGTTGLTNFAHGEMVTFGAVLAFGFSALGLPALAGLDTGGGRRRRPWLCAGRRAVETAAQAGNRPGPHDDREHRPGARPALHHPLLLRRGNPAASGVAESHA